MENRTFNCSWGRMTRWITGGVFCLILFLIVLFSVTGFSDPDKTIGKSLACVVTVSVCLAVVVIPAFFAPLKYYMTSEKIGVSRLGRDIVIPLGDIENVQIAQSADFSGTLRVFGSGGLYGSIGLFWNKRMGSFRAYTTRNDSLVIIKMKVGKLIVLSPDDSEAFVQAFVSFREAK
mgnify:CR=1 FL=1